MLVISTGIDRYRVYVEKHVFVMMVTLIVSEFCVLTMFSFYKRQIWWLSLTTG